MPRDALDRYIADFKGMSADASPTMPQLRAGWERLASPFGPAVDIVFAPADADGVPVEWGDAPNAHSDRILLFYHGGGYTMGSIPSYRGFMGRLSRVCQARTLSVGYRLAPEHPFPAGPEDALTAYRWLVRHDVAPDRIVLAGDSAGAGLLLSTLISLRDAGERLPAAAVCFSPSTDLAKEGESIRTRAALDPLVGAASTLAHARRYVGPDGDLKHPQASPLYADLARLPPLYILVGTDEILFDDSTRFVAKARAAGTEVRFEIGEGMIHIWPFFADILPEGEEAIARVGEFVKSHVP